MYDFLGLRSILKFINRAVTALKKGKNSVYVT